MSPWAVLRYGGQNLVLQSPTLLAVLHPGGHNQYCSLPFLGWFCPQWLQPVLRSHGQCCLLVETTQYCTPPTLRAVQSPVVQNMVLQPPCPDSAAAWWTQPVLHTHRWCCPIVDPTQYCSHPSRRQCCPLLDATGTAVIHQLGSAAPWWTEPGTVAPPPHSLGGSAPWSTQLVLHPHGQCCPLRTPDYWEVLPPSGHNCVLCHSHSLALLPPGGHNRSCTPMGSAVPWWTQPGAASPHLLAVLPPDGHKKCCTPPPPLPPPWLVLPPVIHNQVLHCPHCREVLPHGRYNPILQFAIFNSTAPSTAPPWTVLPPGGRDLYCSPSSTGQC